jgi:PAS domain S-box-containing protein
MNAVAESLTGWRMKDAAGRSLEDVFQIVNEVTGQQAESPARRALLEGKVVGLANHTVLLSRDGGARPIDDSAAPIRDDAGRILGVVLVFRDIAERRAAENRLLRSERELNDFFASASVAMHWVGPDGVILRVNQAELAMMGYGRDEYEGRRIAEFHVDRRVIDDVLERLQRGETLQDWPAQLRRKDGSIRDVLIDANGLFEEGRFVLGRCFTRDVTELKQAQELRGQLAAIVESSGDAIVSKSLDGTIRSWNAGAERLFGYSADEAVGRHISLIIPPEYLAEEEQILARLRRGERIDHFTSARLRKDGRRIDVSLTISPIRDEEGRVVAASKTARDITEERQTHQRLAVQDAVTRALAESSRLDAAAPRILSAVCQFLHWQVGSLWCVDSSSGVLRCTAMWHLPEAHVSRFLQATLGRTFPPGIGLPGRVWASGQPAWINDVTRDSNFPRAPIAAGEGLHGAFGFPILLDGNVLGVIEFFSHEIRQPDEGLLQMMTAIGAQIGHFIERRRADEALRESEQRFARFMEQLPGLAWIKDSSGRYVYVNDAAEKAFGLVRAELYGKTDDELFPPETAEQFKHNDRQALKSGSGIQAFEALEHQDGSLHHSIVSKFPIAGSDGQAMLVGGIAIDITERKKAEDALEANEKRLKALVDTAADAIITIDERGTMEAFNPAAERMFGYRRDEVLGRNVNFLMPEPFHGEHDAYIANYLRTGEAKIIGIGREVIGRRKDGRTFPMELAVSEFAHGERRYFTGIVRDITERKRAEEQLKEADRRKDEFLAVLAHELRGPLAPLRNMVEIIKHADNDAQLLQDARDTMDRQLSHMVRLVDDLLDVSRISRDAPELRKEQVELSNVIAQALETCRPLADAAGHEILVDLPAEPLLMCADSVRLAQVFSNLLSNACKYSPPRSRIWIHADKKDGEVVVNVKDGGVGITADMLPRVFDMFTRAGRSRELAQGGLGIGLTLVKRLVELHGGSVQAMSEGPGMGSEFVVRLPSLAAAARPSGRPTADRPVAPAAGPARRILVVDDNVDSARSLALLLRIAGHETFTAHDGQAAVEAAETLEPDVVLLDLGLPKLSGYEVCRQIRQQDWGKDAVLIALTGWGQDDDRRKTQEAGFDAHLVKPVEYRVLSKLIADLQAAPS